MSRKTVDVEWLKNRTNYLLANSEDDMVEQRRGASALLEAALFETDTYKGFSYLSSEWDKETNALLPASSRDETRRRYQ